MADNPLSIFGASTPSKPSAFNKISDTFKDIDLRIKTLATEILGTDQKKALATLNLHIAHVFRYYPHDPNLRALSSLSPEHESGTREFNPKIFDKWIETQDPSLKNTLTRIKANISYVSKETFEVQFKTLIEKLNDFLKLHPNPVILTNGTEKSSSWLITLAKEKDKDSFDYPILPIFDKNPPLKKEMLFVILDDASYTGAQISQTMEKTQNDRKALGFEDRPLFIIACVHMTTLAESRIRTDAQRLKVDIEIIKIQKMKTIQELIGEGENPLTQKDIDLLNQHWYSDEVKPKSSTINPNILKLKVVAKQATKDVPMDNSGVASTVKKSSQGCASRALTYFDHKIPDYLSFPQKIEKAKVQIDGHEFPVIPDIESHYHLSLSIKAIISLMEKLGFTKNT